MTPSHNEQGCPSMLSVTTVNAVADANVVYFIVVTFMMIIMTVMILVIVVCHQPSNIYQHDKFY